MWFWETPSDSDIHETWDPRKLRKPHCTVWRGEPIGWWGGVVGRTTPVKRKWKPGWREAHLCAEVDPKSQVTTRQRLLLCKSPRAMKKEERGDTVTCHRLKGSFSTTLFKIVFHHPNYSPLQNLVFRMAFFRTNRSHLLADPLSIFIITKRHH